MEIQTWTYIIGLLIGGLLGFNCGVSYGIKKCRKRYLENPLYKGW